MIIVLIVKSIDGSPVVHYKVARYPLLGRSVSRSIHCIAYNLDLFDFKSTLELYAARCLQCDLHTAVLWQKKIDFQHDAFQTVLMDVFHVSP